MIIRACTWRRAPAPSRGCASRTPAWEFPQKSGRAFSSRSSRPRAQGRGTGLGLAVVFGIVKQHRGWVDCYSEVDGARASTFICRAPAMTAWYPHPRCRCRRLIAAPKRSCLVDDEAILRDLARMILGKFGYQVLLAEDGVQALEIYQAQREQIRLVVLDLTMPRLSGRDAFQRLVEIDPQVRRAVRQRLLCRSCRRDNQQRATRRLCQQAVSTGGAGADGARGARPAGSDKSLAAVAARFQLAEQSPRQIGNLPPRLLSRFTGRAGFRKGAPPCSEWCRADSAGCRSDPGSPAA